MAFLLGVVDYVVICLMLGVSAIVGLFFRFTGGRQKTTEEFLMGGKNMNIGPVAFSLMATYMSAIAVLGIPAETYKYGPQYFMWMIGLPIGGSLAAYGFIPVFFDMDTSTAYEYLERRFGKSTRTVSSLLFILQMIFYMAVVLYAPSLALNAVTGLSTWISVISLAFVCTFYCSLGGLKAVLWTDVFQSLLMYVCIIAVFVKASMNFGGAQNIFDVAREGGRLEFFKGNVRYSNIGKFSGLPLMVVKISTSVDLTERYTLWSCIMCGIIYGANSFGTSQAQIQRMLSVGDVKKAQKALFWSIPLIVIFNLFCFWNGIAIYSTYHDCDPLQDPAVQLESADKLMPYIILKMFGDIPGLSGLCIAGVFSASLSTVSSAVNSLTAVTIEDFIRPFCFCRCLTESWAAFLAKIIAIVYGGICLLLTFIVANFRGVLEASHVMTGMVGGPTLGIFSLGLFTTTANEPGTLFGLLVGFTVNAWFGFGSYAANLKIPSLPLSTKGCAAMANETFYFLKNSTGTNLSHTANENMTDAFGWPDEQYVLPMYKVSFIWFPVIGAIVVYIVGYVASFIIGIWKKYPVLDPRCVSPLVRNWYFTSSEDKIYPAVEMKPKSVVTEISSTINGYRITAASQT